MAKFSRYPEVDKAYDHANRERGNRHPGGKPVRPALPAREDISERLADGTIEAMPSSIEYFLPTRPSNEPVIYHEPQLEGFEEEFEMLGYHSPDAFAADVLCFDPRPLFAKDSGYFNGKLLAAKPNDRRNAIPGMSGTDSHQFQEDIVANAGDTDALDLYH